MNHGKFVEGACFKKGQFHMKVIKRPENISYRRGIDEALFGSIIEQFEVILIERQISPPIFGIQKHYKLYDWVNIPISEEEFEKEYKEALQSINESYNTILTTKQ